MTNDAPKTTTKATKDDTKQAEQTKSADTETSNKDPIVEAEKARNERPFQTSDYREPRQGVARPLTHAAGPQPPEVQELIDAVAEVRAEGGLTDEAEITKEAETRVKARREAKEKEDAAKATGAGEKGKASV